jgi:ABC-2 type transport system permease protein
MHWSQLHTILWLRWRLTRNQWSRAGGLNAVITLIAAIAGLIIAAVGGIVGLLVGMFPLAKGPPLGLLAIWDIVVGFFLFFWLIGIVSEIQRSETIEIGKLLHLPISLRSIFVVNYLASHLTPSVIIFVPVALGLSLGLAAGRSGIMILLAPLVLGLLFMVTAWTYYLRGWLVTLMVNPRRRRAVIAIVTMVFILISQLPNLLLNAPHMRGRRNREPDQSREARQERVERLSESQVLLMAHKTVPILWVGYGASSLADGRALPALLATGGTFALGALGLGCAYRSTVRFYQGASTRTKTRRKRREREALRASVNFLERRVPGVPQEAGVLALASLRSLTRATEVKMAIGMSVLWLLFFGWMFFLPRGGPGKGAPHLFIVTSAVVFPFLSILQLLFNQFGFDRSGVRTLILLPTPRWQILLGKNLAVLPMAAGIGLLFVVLVALALHISPVLVLAAPLQLMTIFLLLSTAGNLFSILNPYRISPGSLKPTKTRMTTTVLIALSHMFFPVVVAPVFLAPLCGFLFSSVGWLPAGPTTLLFSAIELVVAAVLYRATLPHLGTLLQQREQRILEAVTQEVE